MVVCLIFNAIPYDKVSKKNLDEKNDNDYAADYCKQFAM